MATIEYPALRKVLHYMELDQGDGYERFTPEAAKSFLDEHLNPTFNRDQLGVVENWLSELSRKDLRTFSVGEREDMDKLLPEASHLRQLVSEVMDELFMAVGG